MIKMRDLIWIVAAMIMFSACASSTKLKNSWLDSSMKDQTIHFNKIAVAVMSQNPSIRRSGEDALVSVIKRTAAIPSYTLFPEIEDRSPDQIKARLREAGVDGVVVMRLMGKKEEQTLVSGVPPADYQRFHGYWDYSSTMVYNPTYLRTETTVLIETNVYSLKDEKLIYSAQSESFEPKNVEILVKEIAKEVASDLKTRGVIP